MIFQITHIDFQSISPSEFERLCFELLLKMGYTQLVWRRGGADSGRDMEGTYAFSTPLSEHHTKWFFECKHYAGGVPPEQLHSKLAWADAEQPDHLVFFISSYLTNNARTWLKQIIPQKRYKIQVIEGQELKERVLQFPGLTEQFFAAKSYDTLLIDAKRHWRSFHVIPSFDLLQTIAGNIDKDRLTLNELGFLFIGLYQQFEYDWDRDDYYSGSDPKILAALYPRLQELAVAENLSGLLDEQEGVWEELGGSGFMDDINDYVPGLEGETDATYQYSRMLLRYHDDTYAWKMGYYLFFRTPAGQGFEIFAKEDSDFTTRARYFETLSPAVVDELSWPTLTEESRQVLKKFARVFLAPVVAKAGLIR